MTSKGWIGFDLDGTLALYDRWRGVTHIGDPIPNMIAKVKQYLADGYEVRIFTARAIEPESVPYINQWCEQHIGQALRVTCQKDYDMLYCYDDRSVAVEFNTGNTFSYRITSLG